MTTPSTTEQDARKTLLQVAVKAWALGQAHGPGWADKAARDEQIEAARKLLDSGRLSYRNVASITRFGLPRLRELAPQRGMGGRLEPSSLPKILDLLNAETARTAYGVSATSINLARKILAEGNSARSVERLTGIPASTLRRWAADA